jgi:hypothetical protein
MCSHPAHPAPVFPAASLGPRDGDASPLDGMRGVIQALRGGERHWSALVSGAGGEIGLWFGDADADGIDQLERVFCARHPGAVLDPIGAPPALPAHMWRLTGMPSLPDPQRAAFDPIGTVCSSLRGRWALSVRLAVKMPYLFFGFLMGMVAFAWLIDPPPGNASARSARR